jgi:phenylpropionate dioxygenase-like ring-hydroxylating dioxygenase large terminal subunit
VTDVTDEAPAEFAGTQVPSTGARTATGRTFGNDDPSLRHQWHPVARIDEIGPDPLRVELCGEALVVARLADGIAVLPDVCPHRYAPLSAGRVVDGQLQCPYHGWQFDASGRCRFIPALGRDATVSSRSHLVPPKIVERHGLVFACLAPDGDPPLLDLPEWGAPGVTAVWLPAVTIRCGAAQIIDNFLDFTHFPFVHAGTFGTDEDAHIGDYEVERTPQGLRVRYEHVIENGEDPGVATGERPLLQPRLMEYTYLAPFAARLRIVTPMTGVENTIGFWATPHGRDTCTARTVLLRNDLDGPDDPRARTVADYEMKVLAEDVWMVEQLPSTRIPLDLPAQAHTRADRITVEMRRLLADLAG